MATNRYSSALRRLGDGDVVALAPIARSTLFFTTLGLIPIVFRQAHAAWTGPFIYPGICMFFGAGQPGSGRDYATWAFILEQSSSTLDLVLVAIAWVVTTAIVTTKYQFN